MRRCIRRRVPVATRSWSPGRAASATRSESHGASGTLSRAFSHSIQRIARSGVPFKLRGWIDSPIPGSETSLGECVHERRLGWPTLRSRSVYNCPYLNGGGVMRKLLLAALLLAASSAFAQYPQRPIQLIVPWGAGGGTDATARIIGSLLEKELKQPVNVVNRTGGSGVVGHQAIASSAPDGYTLCLITVEITMMHHVGLTQLRHTDYTPIGLVNADPAGVNVRADSPYKSMKDLLQAIKSNPGKMKASGTGQGGIWHLAIAGLLKDEGIDPNALPWVPSNGAAPGLQDMVAGGVDVVPCSLPEARSMIDAGKVRALAIMDANPPALYPGLPTLKQELGTNWQIAAWRAIAAPNGIPADAQRTLVTALKKVYDSKEYKDFMASRGFGVVWADPGGTAKFMAESDANLGAALKAVGLANKKPTMPCPPRPWPPPPGP